MFWAAEKIDKNFMSEAVTHKEYPYNGIMINLKGLNINGYVSAANRVRRNWHCRDRDGKQAGKAAV